MEKEWYVVNTYSGHENKVKEKLEMRASTMGMEDYIFRVIVPSQTEKVVKNGKEKEVEKKMFPGYILVEMIMTDEAWFIVRNTPGVTGFIGSSGKGAKPFPLTKQEVDKILEKGWILVSCSGTIGNSVFTTQEHAGKLASQHVMRIVPNDQLVAGYVYAFLSTHYGYNLLTQGTFGAVIQHIEPANVSSIPIPVMPDDFQLRIDGSIQKASTLREEAAERLRGRSGPNPATTPPRGAASSNEARS